jgi:hypothetical protein
MREKCVADGEGPYTHEPHAAFDVQFGETLLFQGRKQPVRGGGGKVRTPGKIGQGDPPLCGGQMLEKRQGA